MNLSEATKVKEQLIRFEGKKDKGGFSLVWKIMICPVGLQAFVKQGCIVTFNYDEKFTRLHPRAEYEIYVVRKAPDAQFTMERFESFIERHELEIQTDIYECAFCVKR